MAEKIKKGDFIEVEYDGKLKEEGFIFDTTNEATAKKQGIYSANSVYGKLVVCVGEHQLLEGVDKGLEGKETEKECDINVPAEDGFGKKRSDMLKIVPTNVFTREQIQPMPGLQVNIDGLLGTIRTVSGGRTVVDFNHPLAGKELVYHVKIGKKIADKKEQLLSYLSLSLNLKKEAMEVAVEGDKATITFKMELPEDAKQQLSERIKSVIPFKTIEYKVKKAETAVKKEEKKQ